MMLSCKNSPSLNIYISVKGGFSMLTINFYVEIAIYKEFNYIGYIGKY